MNLRGNKMPKGNYGYLKKKYFHGVAYFVQILEFYIIHDFWSNASK